MLDAAIVFAPLLGGYLFVSTWYRTRFSIARQDSQKLYFSSAIAGGLLFIPLAGVVALTRSLFPNAFLHIGNGVLFSMPLGVLDQDARAQLSVSDVGQSAVLAFLSLIFGWLLAQLLNDFARRDQILSWKIVRRKKKDIYRRVITEIGDDISLILMRALERTMPVMIDTQSGKIYVAWVIEMPEPRHENKSTLRILPAISGYRDEKNKKVVFTTEYSGIYESIIKCQEAQNGPLEHLLIEDFELVIPLSQLIAIKLFDPEAYAAFENNEDEHADTPKAAVNADTAAPVRRKRRR